MPTATSPPATIGAELDLSAPVNSIDEVIHRLDAIIAWAIASRSRIGYFAALYRNVTQDIKEGIDSGIFDHPAVIEQLDLHFASRYLSALSSFLKGEPASECWAFAFLETGRWPPAVVQHLLMAAEAHIGFDLGVVVAEVVPAADLPGFLGDFNRVNAVLAREITAVERNLARIWHPLAIINRWFSSEEDLILDLGMARARAQSWEFAVRLSALGPVDRARAVAEQDGLTTLVSRLIARPGLLARLVLVVVRLGEIGSIARRIEALGRRSSPGARAVGPPATTPPPPG